MERNLCMIVLYEIVEGERMQERTKYIVDKQINENSLGVQNAEILQFPLRSRIRFGGFLFSRSSY